MHIWKLTISVPTDDKDIRARLEFVLSCLLCKLAHIEVVYDQDKWMPPREG